MKAIHVLILLLIGVFIISCGNKFSLQKRKYTKGFYFARTGSNKSEKKQEHISAKKISQQPENNLKPTIETVISENTNRPMKPETTLTITQNKIVVTCDARVGPVVKSHKMFQPLYNKLPNKVEMKKQIIQHYSANFLSLLFGLLLILAGLAMIVYDAIFYFLITISLGYIALFATLALGFAALAIILMYLGFKMMTR